MQFAEDILSGGISGLSVGDMRQYLEFIADQRLVMLGMQKVYGAKNPFSFMDLQDVQELANFFERRVSAYQVAVAGDVSFNEAFLNHLTAKYTKGPRMRYDFLFAFFLRFVFTLKRHKSRISIINTG